VRLLAAAAAAALALLLWATGGVGGPRGYDEAVRSVLLEDWWAQWVLPPVETALIVLLAAELYVRVSSSPAEGRRRRGRYAASAVGVLLLGVSSPVAVLAQAGLLGAHMAQHILLGAVAPLLVLLSLPRAVPGPRTGLARLVPGPFWCLGIWVAAGVVWLAPAVHHETVTQQWTWILQQVAFFTLGLLLWIPIAERVRSAPAWFGTGLKCGYMVAVWFVGLITANVMWFSGTAFYEEHSAAAGAFGISALQDQANAGTVMIVAHCFISFGAIQYLFFRQARESAVEQGLLQAGVDGDTVRAAIRAGRGDALAREHGVVIKARAGID
jgi:cytochrome c oxidase assembly factor CtaG